MTTRNQTTGKPIRISVADLEARIQAGEVASLFDVRNQSEWDRSDQKIPGALRPQGGEIGLDSAWSKDRLLVAY
jgi:rhodanese-related sulfurtransferase